MISTPSDEIRTELLQVLDGLSLERQQEVLDFACFLARDRAPDFLEPDGPTLPGGDEAESSSTPSSEEGRSPDDPIDPTFAEESPAAATDRLGDTASATDAIDEPELEPDLYESGRSRDL